VAAAFGGAYHTLLLTESANVYSCGLNNMGQLGVGVFDEEKKCMAPDHTAEPLLVEGLEGKGVTALAGGEHHSVALTESGDVYAFGRGDNNQLGLADGAEMHPAPVQAAGAPFAPAARTFGSHACRSRLLLAAHARARASQVAALAGVPIRRLKAGSNQNVAVSRAGELYCWGFGEMGQLGNGRAADEKLPTLVGAQAVASRAVLDAASGGQHSVIVAMPQPH